MFELRLGPRRWNVNKTGAPATQDFREAQRELINSGPSGQSGDFSVIKVRTRVLGIRWLRGRMWREARWSIDRKDVNIHTNTDSVDLSKTLWQPATRIGSNDVGKFH